MSRTSSDSRRALSSARRRGAVVVVGMVAALGLSACGGDHPVESGAAAIVGSDRISVADLQTVYTELNAVAKGPAGEPLPQTTLLSWMMVSPIVIPEAAKQGVAVSDDDARTVLDQIRANSEASKKAAASPSPSPSESPEPGEPTPTPSVEPGTYSAPTILAIRSYISSQNIARKLAEKGPITQWWGKVLDQLDADNPQVSPRYGVYQPPDVNTATSFDQLLNLVGTPTPAWFADAAATEPSPSPGATPEDTPGETPPAGTEETPAETTPTATP